MDSFRVIAIDVGSVRSGKYAWAALDVEAPGCLAAPTSGQDPPGTLKAVLESLDENRPTVLAWEAPGSVPIPETSDWAELGRPRLGEGSRPWSASAGATVLATGLAQAGWLCRAIAVARDGSLCTTSVPRWRAQGGILLAEAFVSSQPQANSRPRRQNGPSEIPSRCGLPRGGHGLRDRTRWQTPSPPAT